MMLLPSRYPGWNTSTTVPLFASGTGCCAIASCSEGSNVSPCGEKDSMPMRASAACSSERRGGVGGGGRCRGRAGPLRAGPLVPAGALAYRALRRARCVAVGPSAAIGAGHGAVDGLPYVCHVALSLGLVHDLRIDDVLVLGGGAGAVGCGAVASRRGLLLGALVHRLGDGVEGRLQGLGLGVDRGRVLALQRVAHVLDRGLDALLGVGVDLLAQLRQ